MWRWHRRTDEDFTEEIRANIALETDRFIAEGMNPEQARALALRTFGNVTRAQGGAGVDPCRAARGQPCRQQSHRHQE